MTKSELNRRVYLETANAINLYLNRPVWRALAREEEKVADAMQKLAETFTAAAEAIFESQKAGVDP